MEETARKQGEWYSKKTLRFARSHGAAAVYNGRIYLFGGGGNNFQSLNSVEIYDPRDDRWSLGKEMPSIRSGAMAVTLNNKIYVIGGGFKKPDGKFVFLKKVEIYDPYTNEWENGPDLIIPHDYPAIAVLNDNIYIIGGHHPNATEGGPKTDPGSNFCEMLDIGMGKWSEIAPLPTPRFGHSAIVLNGEIVTTGGVAFTSNGFNNFDIAEVYNIGAKAWRRELSLSLPWTAAAHASSVLNGKIYIFGGYSGAEIHDRVACYDPSLKRWKELQPMDKPRAAMPAVVIDDTIYLIGGWEKDGRSVMNNVIAYLPPK